MTDADPNPAPGSLLLVQEFVNTLDIEEGTDAIDTPERLRSWLVAHGLAAASARPSTGDVARAADVREGLRALLLANNGAPLDERAVRRLNRAAAEPHLRLRVAAGGRAVLQPVAADPAGAALGTILAGVYAAMADGTWARLKACRSDECRWAFYDLSKNRSGHWCSMAVCGSREKVRAFRARHATPA